MRNLFRVLLAGLFVATLVIGPGGCTTKEEGKPNPDLKVPDVPPGDRGSGKGGPVKPPGSN